MIKNGGGGGGKSANQRSPKTASNDISIDLHVSSQMILLYPDIDSENLIKEAVSLFNKAVQKQSMQQQQKSNFFLTKMSK